jgi:hypothetical protein
MFKYLLILFMSASMSALPGLSAFADSPRHGKPPRIENNARHQRPPAQVRPAKPHYDKARDVPRRHHDPGLKAAPPRHDRYIPKPAPRAHIHVPSSRIHSHYRPYHLRYLPRSHIRLVIGALDYYYVDGLFYRPYAQGYISAQIPIGTVLTTLPQGYRVVLLGDRLYYALGGSYFVETQGGYQAIANPGATEINPLPASSLFIYPNLGQSEDLQARDRYECHLWGSSQTGFDPTTNSGQNHKSDDYQRAMGACLEARGYTVK